MDGDGADGGNGGDGESADPVGDARNTFEQLLDQYEGSAELLDSIDDDGRVEIEITALASNVSALESAANGLGEKYEAEANALLAAAEYLDPIVGGLEEIRAGTGALIAVINDLVDSSPGADEMNYSDALPILDEADGGFGTGVGAFRDQESQVGDLPQGGNAVTESDISRLESTHETVQSQTIALNSLAGALREYAEGATTHAEGNTKMREAREALGDQDPQGAETAMEDAKLLMNEAAETLDEATSLLDGTDPSMAPVLESKIDLMTCRSKALRDGSEKFAEAADIFLQAGDVEDKERGEKLQQQHVEAVNEGAEAVVRCEDQ